MLERIKRFFVKREYDRVPEGPIIESDFDIIKALADAKEPLKASEIHEKIGGRNRMSRQNLHKRLNSLNDSGYVSKRGNLWRLTVEPRREIYITELLISFFTFIIGVPITGSIFPAFVSVALLADLGLRWFVSRRH